MRVLYALFFSIGFGFMGVARAAEPPGASFDVLINLADQRRVHLALTVPDGTTHQLQVDGDLAMKVRVWWGSIQRYASVTLVNTAGDAVRTLTGIDKPTRPDGEILPLSISVCGDRFISVADSAPRMCSNLPPTAKPDRVFPANCLACTGPYEDMPATITSHERIAPASEPGEPLTVTGRVLGPDGQPRAGIIVYGYHTDWTGIYPPSDRIRSDASNFHGRLRGWVRSDAQGRYTFDTIWPASYPNSTMPQHIHLHVVEPGCSAYIIDEMLFSDDPMFQRLSTTDRERETPGIGGPGVVTPRKKGKRWEVTRDIHLGEKVPEYETCGAPK
jgi:protocatechuate 3,4-dioxygenase beta subunit